MIILLNNIVKQVDYEFEDMQFQNDHYRLINYANYQIELPVRVPFPVFNLNDTISEKNIFNDKKSLLNFNTLQIEFDDGIAVYKQNVEVNIVSCSFDKSIKNFKLETEECLKTMSSENDEITCSLLIDSTTIACACETYSINLWNLQTGKNFKTLVSEYGNVCCMTLLDSNTISSGSELGRIEFWDLKSGCTTQSFLAHLDQITSLIISNSCLISSSEDKTIKAWSLIDGYCLLVITTNTSVYSLLELNSYYVAAGECSTVGIWNLCKDAIFSESNLGTASNELKINSLDGHKAKVKCLVKLDSKTFASASLDLTINIWNFEEATLIRTIHNGASIIWTLLAVNSTTVVTGSGDKYVRIWDISTGKLIKVLECSGSVRGLALIKKINE